MGLVQIFSQISRIDKPVLETGGWSKKNKNQLRNNIDFYVWEISQYVLYRIKTVYIPDTSNLSNKSDAANESDKSGQINLTVCNRGSRMLSFYIGILYFVRGDIF